MSTNTTYAGRKRRKPIQKSAKAPVEGAKSNPSKRHRDRLNGELERMANLLPLPQDVISRLDKLTILRLSVSYLRAKSFFNVTLKSNSGPKPDGNGLKQLGGEDFLEGELLLQVLSGFVLVVTADGLVFFVSSTIQDYLGFHQTDVIHQSVYDLIHTEDRAEFQRQLHWSLNPNPSPEMGQESPDGKTAALPVTYYRPEQLPPENSTFLERNFVCRLRCLLDNSSGFMAMTFQGRLKFLHGQNQKSKDGQPIPPQLALFALATPLQPPSILEIRTKNFIFRTKHKMDFTPTACDAKGKIVLGYTEAELSSRGSGYQFIHAADMLYCAENHIRMIKTGESGVTVFRLLTKQSRWVWVQANARLVYKNGRPDCIIASQRVITEEEGEEHVRKRNLRLPFCFTTGEAVLYDTSVISGDDVDPSKRARTVHPDSLLGSLMKQDESIYVCLPAQNQNSFQHGALADSGDDLDRILSGDWQDDVLSLSENGIFKPDADSDVSMEDKSGDLLCFMKSLGICREDLELIQKDEEFLSVSLDNQDSLMDVEDEILSYLHESINRASDCIFANAADRKPDSGCATPLQQHGALLCLRQGQPLSLAQPAQPMTLLHQQTQTHPHQPITEQHLHTQIHPHQQNQQQYPCMQTQQPITHQQLQTQQPITHQQLQTQQPITHQQLQTQQPITHQQLQTQQPITHQQLQTQQPIIHQQLQTQQPITHQQLQTQQPIIHQQLQTQQPVTHQQLHTQTQQPVAQQYFHAQGQQPNTQQHLHTQALQPITADHLYTQAQQPITQQNLHPQAHPLQIAPQQHALVQQQLPQQQLTQIDLQQQPYTQVHPHQNLHAQIHPQQHTPQQQLSAQAHPEELLLQQDQSVSLQKQQLLNLQQQCQPTVAQPMISHAQQPLPLQQLPQQPGYPPLQSLFPEQQRQLCHKMRQMQVNGKCQPVTQPPTTNGHPLPALFHAEQSFPEYGHLFLEGSGVEMPYRNQLNTLSITCNQEFSPYKIPEGLGTGDQSTPQDLEELLESLQPGALGQEQGGNSAPLCHPRALPMHQLLPETPGLARGQQLNPKLFALSTLGNQPYLANVQNGDNGDMIQTHPESSNGIDLPQAAIPLHQHPAEGRPFQNLTTGGFV